MRTCLCRALLAVALVPLCVAAGLTDQQGQWLARAERHEKAGWIYLHVEGGARERGFQHGYLLAPEITECLRVRRAVWHHNTGMAWSWLLKEVARFMTPAVDKENRQELLGMVEGMQANGQPTTLDELVTYNAAAELDDYWWPEVQKKMDGSATVVAPPHQSCSSFIATGSLTKDGGVVLGHNTMFSYVEALSNLVIDIVPEKGHRILMQSQAGWIHSGTDFFLTDAGLVGSETTIGNFHGFTEKGLPEFARMRRATQDAGSLDEWCAIMKKGNNGGYANAWLIGDIHTREIARLELGLKYVGFERTHDGYFLGSNIAEDLRILRLETDMNDMDIRLSSVARRVRWKQLMKEHAGLIDLTKAKAMEADCYDTCFNKELPGGRTLASHSELDPQIGSTRTPFNPGGTFDAKVVDTSMARRMSFAARWGSADGTAFDAAAFLQTHAQFDWLAGLLKSRPAQPWVDFSAGEKN